MNKSLLGFIFLALAIGGYFFLSKKEAPQPLLATPTPQSIQAAVDIKASFEIHTKGTKRIFTDSRYHNLSADVFIDETKPNTVNIKKEGITWADFFATLPMELTKDCLVTGTKQTFCTGDAGVLKFYLNGEEDKDALEREIKAGDSFLVKFE